MPFTGQSNSKNLDKKDFQQPTLKNVCNTCRAMGNPPPCKGHGAAGGGTKEVKNKTGINATNIPNQVAGISNQVAAVSNLGVEKATAIKSQLFSDMTVHYEVGFLSIESDRVRGNLTFRLRPGLAKDEIEAAHEFLELVKTEFDVFKNQLAEQGISVTNMTAVMKDHELTIHIPHPKYYDAFIKHLESTNLLPIPSVKQQNIKEKQGADKNTASYQSIKPACFESFSSPKLKLK